MSERSTLHWLMGRAGQLAVLQDCLQLAAATDTIVLLAEAVLLAQQSGFEKLIVDRHIVICRPHWEQLAGTAPPAAVELLTWPQIVTLIKQHPLQHSWT